jgi:hypothetical protein
VINQEELAVCRRRGHKTHSLLDTQYWAQCSHCGMWLRRRVIVDEREDEPPEPELDPSVRLDRTMKKLRGKRDDEGGEQTKAAP